MYVVHLYMCYNILKLCIDMYVSDKCISESIYKANSCHCNWPDQRSDVGEVENLERTKGDQKCQK